MTSPILHRMATRPSPRHAVRRLGALLWLPLVALLAVTGRAQDDGAPPPPLKVLASVPTYGALATEIGAGLVDVYVPTRPGQDMHTVTATPSIMARVRDTDLVLHTGLDAEFWLEPLLRGSGNTRLLGDPRRMVALSDGIRLLEVPTEVSRRAGDIHAFGNVHVWADPLNVRIMAARVKDALVALRPGAEAAITARHAAFHERLTRALVRWLTDYQGLKGRPVVTYHRSWVYFLERFGLTDGGTVEPKPRVAPTASHLDELVTGMRAREVGVIIAEPFHSPEATDFLVERTGAKVLVLSTHPGFPEGDPATADIVGHFEHNLAALAAALGLEVSHQP